MSVALCWIFKLAYFEKTEVIKKKPKKKPTKKQKNKNKTENKIFQVFLHSGRASGAPQMVSGRSQNDMPPAKTMSPKRWRTCCYQTNS